MSIEANPTAAGTMAELVPGWPNMVKWMQEQISQELFVYQVPRDSSQVKGCHFGILEIVMGVVSIPEMSLRHPSSFLYTKQLVSFNDADLIRNHTFFNFSFMHGSFCTKINIFRCFCSICYSWFLLKIWLKTSRNTHAAVQMSGYLEISFTRLISPPLLISASSKILR